MTCIREEKEYFGLDYCGLHHFLFDQVEVLF